MQLTRYTDYGFRLLTYLALLPKGQRASINEISDIYNISRNNMNKVVHQLSKEGVIETKQGKGGGILLKVTPEDINVGEILLLLENSVSLVDCFSPECRIVSACILKDVFNEAVKSFMDILKSYTLKDLIQPNQKQMDLIQVLKIENK